MTEPRSARRRLYHAAPSYYSMIARLALAETGSGYESTILDIHRRQQQFDPSYVRLNPNMTVPTLVTDGRILADSRDILNDAFHARRADPDGETQRWLDRLYAFPVEELTMGRLMSINPLARFLLPRVLQRVHRRLLQLAVANPDLGPIYTARASVFAKRIQIFDPASAVSLFSKRWNDAEILLDEFERTFGEGRRFLGGDHHGPSDVVATVFLSRVRFVGKSAALAARPALYRYVTDMEERASYRGADIWPRLKPLKMLRQVLF